MLRCRLEVLNLRFNIKTNFILLHTYTQAHLCNKGLLEMILVQAFCYKFKNAHANNLYGKQKKKQTKRGKSTAIDKHIN